jgi:hypothetical protein
MIRMGYRLARLGEAGLVTCLPLGSNSNSERCPVRTADVQLAASYPVDHLRPFQCRISLTLGLPGI